MALEFAAMFPLAFLLFAGLMSYGVALGLRYALADAADFAARGCVLGSSPVPAACPVQNIINNRLAGRLALCGGSVGVTPSVRSLTGGPPVLGNRAFRVDVSCQFVGGVAVRLLPAQSWTLRVSAAAPF